MATIAQVSPVADSITAGVSATYANQLNTLGGVGQVQFTTIVPSSDLLVFPGGAVQTTGSLNVGTYSVQGTSADQHGNTGVWLFTLTVTGAISPQTSAVQVTTSDVTASGIEILVPFQIDPATGGVAVVTNYVQILAQHIETIILTALTERVMMPTYGCGLAHQVFSPISSIDSTLLASDIKTQVEAWEPAVQLGGVYITNSPAIRNELDILVTFAVLPYRDINTLTLTVGGSIDQVISP